METKTRKENTIDSALEKMISGYCLKSHLKRGEMEYIFENFGGAAIVKIVSAGLHGGRHYSIHDLLGHSVKGMVFVVIDTGKFSDFVSLELERDFKKTNPTADSRTRAAFTSFMHENKLHWSGCRKSRVIRLDISLRGPELNMSQ